MPAQRYGNGQLVIAPWAPPPVQQLIFQRTTAYEGQMLPAQNANIARFRGYQVQAAATTELSLAVYIDGSSMGERSISGTTIVGGGSLPPVAIQNPTPATVRRIRNGDFDTQVRFRFRDARVGTIDASFDVERVLDDYIRHSQEAIASSRSSGWQILGFGSRRNRVRQSLNEQISRQASSTIIANTTIIMEDASDDQVKRFEETFFPRISQNEAIQSHLAAAEAARAAGRTQLADAHARYADALQSGVKLQEVDAVAAAAALAAGDYASFIAHGVRWGEESGNFRGTFVRVAHETIRTRDTRRWTDVQQRSVQREVTVVLLPERATSRPRFGICGYDQGMRPGSFFITCLEANSPLADAGAMAGEMVEAIGGMTFANNAQLEQVIGTLRPGQVVSVRFVDPMGNWVNRQVRLKRGDPAQ